MRTRSALVLIGLLAACAEGAGPPTGPDLLTVTAHAGADQEAIGNTTVPTPPAVRVTEDGAPRTGVMIEFTVLEGGGQVTEHLVPTDADGVARVGSWRLGAPGTEQLLSAHVRLTNQSVEFAAQAITGPFYQLEGRSGLPFDTAVPVGAELISRLAVTSVDRGGNPVPGVPVVWTTDPGSGVLQDADLVTGPDGIARARSWRLSTTSGRQAVSVRAVAAPSHLVLRYSVMAVPGPAASIERLTPEHLVASPGANVPEPPRVRVRDAYGNLVYTRQAIFTVTEGGGSVDNTHQILDANGTAGVMRWTLGPIPGTHRVRVQVDQVFTEFTATTNGP